MRLADADQRAVVRRFGAIAAHSGPGMHYRLPWPMERVDVVKTTSVMKVGVGFALPAGTSDAPVGPELLTGDTNLLNVALVRQYVVRDPAEFLLSIEDAPSFVETIAEGVLTETVLAMPVDEVLTRGRVLVQDRVKTRTQEILDLRRSGISIISASIVAMTLDQSVAKAFQDVTDAIADRDKMINEADAHTEAIFSRRREARRARHWRTPMPTSSTASPKPSARPASSSPSKKNTPRCPTSPGPGSTSRRAHPAQGAALRRRLRQGARARAFAGDRPVTGGGRSPNDRYLRTLRLSR